jgi:hypothetical protein
MQKPFFSPVPSPVAPMFAFSSASFTDGVAALIFGSSSKFETRASFGLVTPAVVIDHVREVMAEYEILRPVEEIAPSSFEQVTSTTREDFTTRSRTL